MIYVCLLLTIFMCEKLPAQNSLQIATVVPSPASNVLEVTTNKTVSLIFPAPIKDVDWGSKDVLVQKASKTDNVLFVKAGNDHMTESSLSVITDEGEVFSFTVIYTASPSRLVLYPGAMPNIMNNYSNDSKVLFAGNEISANELIASCHHVAGCRKFLHGVKNKSSGMEASVNGIYIKNEIFYCQLVLNNRTNVDYNIDNVRLYIRDKKKGKRTAIQEQDMTAIYHSGDLQKVLGQENNIIVLALHQFTIPDDKTLFLTITEKNGGRHLKLRLTNQKLIQARLF
jgi:conjugative transposon TraN protein